MNVMFGRLKKSLSLGLDSTLLIYIIFVLSILPIIFLRDFTPANELRYLCIADESIRNGNFFAFTHNGLPYADKPPLYLWLVILCRFIAGSHQMWLLSLISLLPAIVTTYLMNDICRHLLTNRQKMAASLMLLSTAYFLAMSVTLRMDMLMTMFIVLSIRSYIRLTGTPPRYKHLKDRWLFPLWIFLAVFSKGPIGILVPLVTTVCFSIMEKDYKSLRIVWGLRTWSVLLTLCALWFIGVYFDGGTEYLDNLLFHQTVDRAVNSFHHSRPVWWYAETIWYVAAPWSLVTVVFAVWSLMHLRRESRIERLMLVEISVTFLLLSLISGKLQVYLIPLLPFLIYSFWNSRLMPQHLKTVRTLAIIPVALCMFPFPMMILGADKWLPLWIGGNWFIRCATAVLFAGSVNSIVIWTRQKDMSGFRKGVVCFSLTIFATVFTAGLSLRSLSPYIGLTSASEHAIKIAETNNIPLTDVYTCGIKRSENLTTLFNGATPKTIDIMTKRDISNNDSLNMKNREIICRFKDELRRPVIVLSGTPLFKEIAGGKSESVGMVEIVLVEPTLNYEN